MSISSSSKLRVIFAFAFNGVYFYSVVAVVVDSHMSGQLILSTENVFQNVFLISA